MEILIFCPRLRGFVILQKIANLAIDVQEAKTSIGIEWCPSGYKLFLYERAALYFVFSYRSKLFTLRLESYW